MLLGMVEVHNLHRPRKLLASEIPNPAGSVSDDHHLLGSFETRMTCQRVEQLIKPAKGGASSDILLSSFFGGINPDIWS